MTADEVLRQSVKHEVVHGEQALASSRALHDLGMYNDALSRLYYAAFHFAAALLLTEGVEPRRHRALPGLLLSHLASAGFDASDAARVARLSTYRDMADYERAFDATPAVVHEALNDAVAFVDRLVPACACEACWTRSRRHSGCLTALSAPSASVARPLQHRRDVAHHARLERVVNASGHMPCTARGCTPIRCSDNRMPGCTASCRSLRQP